MSAGAQRGGTISACAFVSTRRRAGLSSYEVDFATAQRKLNRGWQTIANMLQRPVADVRAHCDPTWESGQ